MGLVVVNSNTTTPVVGVTSALDTETGASQLLLYVFAVDTSAMVGGASPDETTLTVKTALLAAGTRQNVYSGSYRGVQAGPIKVSPPIPVGAGSIEFDLLQSAGTARAYPWVVFHLGEDDSVWRKLWAWLKRGGRTDGFWACRAAYTMLGSPSRGPDYPQPAPSGLPADFWVPSSAR